MYILEYHNNIGHHENKLADIIRLFENSGFIYTLQAQHPELNKFQDVNLLIKRNED